MVIKQVVIVGAGVMGQGIAYVFALAGYTVTLLDIVEEQLKTAFDYAKRTGKKGVERGKISESKARELLTRLHLSTDFKQSFQNADFIIETVPEKRGLKKQVLEAAGSNAPIHAIITSNTSTMSPTELASFTNRPGQFAVMHFFNPVPQMPLVEIVKGLDTLDETVDSIKTVAKKIGKETVEVNEYPGFVTSRISALVGNEAFYMLQEGVASASDIDKAIKLGLNYPMGPLELGDLVGLDTRLNNLRYLHQTLGEKYRPAPLLEQYVKAGRLGRKSGRGVYDYTNENELIKK